MKKLIASSLLLFPLLASALHYSDSVPYPFYHEDTSGETQMMPLHRGEESFQMRIDLIQKAQKTIEAEYYIYYMDMAGKIFNRELIKAAERGVKVRVLLDKFAAGVDEFLAYELEQHGIEVKFYNTASMLRLDSINFRNHRKLFVVDGEEAIAGGRNMADDYYNLDAKYNYEDRDVFVKGPLVTVMRDSFNAFWENKISQKMKRHSRPHPRYTGDSMDDGDGAGRKWDKKVKAVQDFLKETPEELTYRAAIAKAAEIQLSDNNIYPCPVATFVTDSPGKKGSMSDKDYNDNNRHVRKAFLDKILPIDKALTISSPYFIPNERNEYIFEDILKRGIEVNLYSNSLRSTDALFMSANLYMHLPHYLKQGMKVYFNDRRWSDLDVAAVDTAKTADWGTHAKTHVYETKTYTEVMIGSYNLDNRSDYFNTELAIFCKGNDDFTQDVKGNIMALANRGLKVESLKHAIDRSGQKVNITGASSLKQMKMKLLAFPAWLVSNLL
ncbi:MAG: phospholipase D family protein [Bacteriovoracaceae bacterium]